VFINKNILYINLLVQPVGQGGVDTPEIGLGGELKHNSGADVLEEPPPRILSTIDDGSASSLSLPSAGLVAPFPSSLSLLWLSPNWLVGAGVFVVLNSSAIRSITITSDGSIVMILLV